jgi:hypothetical protein
MDSQSNSFATWAKRWMDLARYTGSQLPDPSWRTEQVVALWHEGVPGNWRRRDDEQLLNPSRRYRRTHKHERPHPEHAIELEMLGRDAALKPMHCLGAPVIDSPARSWPSRWGTRRR